MIPVEERLDEIAERLDQLTALLEAEAEERRASRAVWSELGGELWPIAGQVVDRASLELADVEDEVTLERLGATLRILARSLPDLEALAALVSPVAELGREVSPLVGPAVEAVSDRMAAVFGDTDLVGFAGAAGRLAGRITGSFTADDVDALGDNVVLILQTVRDMTQPEIMRMLRRTVHGVSEEEAYAEIEEPPGLLALVRELRRPEARRGLNRLVHILGSLGAEEATSKETTP